MTFWKLFWNKTKNSSDKSKIQANTTTKRTKILIKDFDYKDKKINIIFKLKNKNN